MKLRVAFLLLLASCTLRPPLESPQVDIPENWRVTADEASTLCNARWWEQFEDPVLNHYILTAICNNRDLKRAAWRVEEFRGLWGVAFADYYPQINGVIQKYRQESSLFGDTIIPGTPRLFNFYSVMAQFTYEIDVWGRIKDASDAALSDYLGENETKKTILLTLVSNVATSYMRMRRLDLQLEISIKTLASREEGYHINKLRFEGGLTSELEVKQAETEVKAAQAAIINIERRIAVEENLLSVLIGQTPGDRERGLDLEKLVHPFEVPAGIPSDVLWQRPDLRQKYLALFAATARIGEAKAAFFPTISLTGFYGSQSIQLKTLLSGPARTWQFGGLIEQPIFNGFRIKSYYEVAGAREKQALYDFEYAIQIALREVNDALIGQIKSKELEAVLIEQVQVLRDYLALAQLQYDNGQTDYLSVLDAQRRLFDAQLNLADAEGDRFISLIELYKALGGGWVEDADDIFQSCSCSCEEEVEDVGINEEYLDDSNLL